MTMEFVPPRNVSGSAAISERPALEPSTADTGYFVDTLRVTKQRRRTDTLVRPMPLSELPMMKALLVAPEALEAKPKAK